MIVVEESKSLVLNLKNPNRVLHSITKSKLVTYNNHELVVTPHTIDASIALRSMGIKVPSPILHYYNWS